MAIAIATPVGSLGGVKIYTPPLVGSGEASPIDPRNHQVVGSNASKE